MYNEAWLTACSVLFIHGCICNMHTLMSYRERTDAFMLLLLLFLQDYSDTARLLNRDNIDEGFLWDYAIEAAAWSTELPKLDFAVSVDTVVMPHDIKYQYYYFLYP